MRILLYPAVLGIALFTNAAAADVLEEFRAEDWNGMAFADDQSGKLANCSVYAQYENGVTLYFFNNADGSWMLGLNKDDWALTQDSRHDIAYRVDSRRATNATAVALSTKRRIERTPLSTLDRRARHRWSRSDDAPWLSG